MSENNEMIPKQKMGFVQRVRKSMLIRNIDEAKYMKAYSDLQTDIDVVTALLTASPNSASILPYHIKIQAIEQEPVLFGTLPAKEQMDIAEVAPEYVSRMPEDTALEYIHRHGTAYIKYLPEALQEKLLTEDVKVENTLISFNPEWMQRVMDNFSPSVVERVVSSTAQNAKAEDATEQDKKAFEDMLTNASLAWMSVEMQQKIVNIDGRFIDRVSEEAFVEIIQANPELIKNTNYHLRNISLLPIETQLDLATVDSRVVSEMSSEALSQYVQNDPQALSVLSSEEQIKLAQKHPEYMDILDDEQKREMSQITAQDGHEEGSKNLAAPTEDEDFAI